MALWKRWGFIWLVSAMICCTGVSASAASGEEETADTPAMIEIMTETETRTNTQGKIYWKRVRSYPVITFESNPEISDKINSYYQAVIQADLDAHAEAFLLDYCGENPDANTLSFALEYSEQLECKRTDSNVLSFGLFHWDYTGGSHPGETYDTKNFSMKTGEFLYLPDILKEGVASEEQLIQRVADHMNEEEEIRNAVYDASQIPDYARKVVQEGTDWYFSDDGIVVYFPPYAVAAYAYSTIEVAISAEELKGIVQEDYLQPGIPCEIREQDEQSVCFQKIYDAFSRKNLTMLGELDGLPETEKIAHDVILKSGNEGKYVYFFNEAERESRTGIGVGVYAMRNPDGTWGTGYGWYFGEFVDGKRQGVGSLYWIREAQSPFYFYLEDGTWSEDTISGDLRFTQYTYLNDRYVQADFSGTYTNGLENGLITMNCVVDGYSYTLQWNSANGIRQEITPPEGFVMPEGCYLAAIAYAEGTDAPRYYYGEPGRIYGIGTELYRSNETGEEPVSEEPVSFRSAKEQEYNGTIYTTLDLCGYADEEYYQDKTVFSNSSNGEFICYGDKIYYTAGNQGNLMNEELFCSNPDGSETFVIDSCCLYQSEFVAEKGKLYYTHYEDYGMPSYVMCYDPVNRETAVVFEGILICSGYGYLYAYNGAGTYRINAENWNDQVLITASQAKLHTAADIMAETPARDGAGNLVYQIYHMQTGSMQSVAVPDQYEGSMDLSAPWYCAGDYLFTYGSGLVAQYLLTDGSLISQIPANDETAFRYGTAGISGEDYVAVQNGDSWKVFSAAAGEWLPDVSTAQSKQLIYEWILSNCSPMSENLPLPQSAEELDSLYPYLMHVGRDSVYIGFMGTSYFQNGKTYENGAPIAINVYVVKLRTDGSAKVIGGVYWQ